MGQRGTTAVLDPKVSIETAASMTPTKAKRQLRATCRRAGFEEPAIDKAFYMFAGAVKLANADITKKPRPFIVNTVTYGETSLVEQAHGCMQAISADPTASELAARAFDAAPGTEFQHTMRGDACHLTATCTNAPRRR